MSVKLETGGDLGAIRARQHELYNFPDADLEILVVPHTLMAATQEAAIEGRRGVPPLARVLAVKYRVHQRNIIAQSSVLETLIEQATAPSSRSGTFRTFSAAPTRRSGTESTESARKRVRRNSAQAEAAETEMVKIEVDESPLILDLLLPYFYRGGKGTKIPLPDLAKSSFEGVMALLQLADKYGVALARDMLEERFCHWLPTAAERGEVSASDAFELYRYACNANHPQLKAVSLEATHTDTIDASILTFEQEQSRALPTEHVDDLWRHHFKEDRKYFELAKAYTEPIPECPAPEPGSGRAAKHGSRCFGPPCQSGEKVIKDVKIPIVSVAAQDGAALSQQIWAAFKRDRERCERCTQNMDYRINTLAAQYSDDDVVT